jgi:hypothetical protein
MGTPTQVLYPLRMAASDNAQARTTPTDTLDYATPREDRARVAIRLNPSVLVLGAAFLLLSMVSFGVVIQSADEPFYGTIRKSDAVGQVGLGCVLIAFWICWCVALGVQIFRRRMHLAWCAALLLAGFAIFILVECVDGYLSDLITFQSTPALWEGWQRPAPPTTASSAPRRAR